MIVKGLVTIAIIGIIIIGVSLVSYSILSNQKKTIYVNLLVKYETNFAYRALVSFLNLDGVYYTISTSDYYGMSEEKKEYLVKKLNLTLLRFKCYKLVKENRLILEYPYVCIGKSGGSVVPLFVPGGKVEKLYLSYER